MRIVTVKERATHERRVAITPDTAEEFSVLGLEVAVQSGAGELSGYSDEDYRNAGAQVVQDATKVLKSADVVLKVSPPSATELSALKQGTVVAGLLGSGLTPSLAKKYADKSVSAFALEFLPRITRAQSMDVLSSQSNLAGYKAVIDAVAAFGRVVPMMMTAAGTIQPAKVLVLGAGVAGLQAIATAKRLGAIVRAFDVRPQVKEQVESLGAEFIAVDDSDAKEAETKGGYAKEMSDDYKQRQSVLIHEAVREHDIVICTALIPGKPAPVLITQKMLKDMKPGSVVVDLATSAGGNCQASVKDKMVVKNGVIILGHTDMPSRVCSHASQLYAKNLYNFITPLVNQKLDRIKIDFEDDIVKATLITFDGKVVHSGFKTLKPTKPSTHVSAAAKRAETPKERIRAAGKKKKLPTSIKAKKVSENG